MSAVTHSRPPSGGQTHHHHHPHGQQGAHDHLHGRGLLSGHHHHHHHTPPAGARSWAFAVGALLNVAFVAGEVVYGVLGRSMALLADAGHNLGDVLGLLAAWVAASLASRKPTERFSYGLGSSSVLAALLNAVTLLVVTGAVVAEAVRRLFEPQPSAGFVVMAVAAAGVLVNGLTAALFASGRRGELNSRGAFLHMMSDAVVAFGVVIAGAAILATGWTWLDPAVSLVISAVILWGAWSLLRESLAMALAAAPSWIEPAEVRAHLLGQDGVAGLHDLHIWSMSTTETALTCHLLMPRGHPGDRALEAICEGLQTRFRIGHATLQVEMDAETACRLETAHAV